MRRICVAAIAAAVAAVALSAGAAGSTTTTTISLLRFGETVVFSSLNPAKNSGSAYTVYGMLEALYEFGPDGALRPELATSVTRPGRDIYVYHLRHRVKFWDGTEMTSADVANSLNFQRFPAFLSSSQFTSVKSIRATDRYTVVVTLKRPDASWNGTAGLIFEKKFADAHPGTMGNPGVLIMGTGAWEPVSFDPTTGLELTANPLWWGGKVPIQRISVKFFSDETSEALAFRAGGIDAAMPRDGRAFASASGARILSVPNNFEMFLGMNTRVAPWNDVHVRRAVAYALNRADIIASFGGYGTPVYSFIPSIDLRSIAPKTSVIKLLNSIPQYRYSLAKAKAELAKSAYPNGFSATFPAPNVSDRPQLQQVIAAQLQKIGIELKVDAISIPEWYAEIAGPKDNHVGINFIEIDAQSTDPGTIPGVFVNSKNARAGALNFANYMSPAVDALLKQGLSTQNPANRLDVYGQLLKRLASDLPYVPIAGPNSNLALSNGFTFPGYSSYLVFGPWPLYIKAKA